ncbi:MAG TPA: 2-C-methyl-D-erythritol 4-phosphate cytidylyltransferase, partial [Bacteroidales bacterium]|nr:2-C-methyl-D-erythritol 4-phosphate cytidylyltransferase [Bacteroidales bacterium]
MEKIALIVAGGTGKRMSSEVPKQFMVLAGLPILMHTIKKFWFFENSIKIIVVLPEDHIKHWKKLCREYRFVVRHTIRKGGETRFHSVKNGLRGIKPGCLVAIHDGVRPLVSRNTIKRCFAKAEKTGAAIPVIDISESIRFVKGSDSQTADRARYKIVQTPQVFQSKQLIKAFKKPFDKSFTDDATVVEGIGQKISMVEGNPENIKITGRLDMIVA